MTNEEAVKHLTNDWYISLSGQICIDADVADSFLKAVGIGIKAINGQEKPHAHIDLEAWTAEWVDNDESEEMMCKCSKCGYPVSYFWGKTGFCPGCGKAMTPEAQTMLEKRFRGCVE